MFDTGGYSPLFSTDFHHLELNDFGQTGDRKASVKVAPLAQQGTGRLISNNKSGYSTISHTLPPLLLGLSDYLTEHS